MSEIKEMEKQIEYHLDYRTNWATISVINEMLEELNQNIVITTESYRNEEEELIKLRVGSHRKVVKGMGETK